MFEAIPPRDQAGVIVPPKGTEIVLAEGEGNPLLLVLPPDEDLNKIREIKESQFSLSESFESNIELTTDAFADQLSKEKAKLGQFGSSPAFLARLARLANKAKDYEAEDEFSRDAFARDTSDFFAHLRADTLIAQGNVADAEGMLVTLALSSDTSAHLKLAAFAVRRQDFATAQSHVAHAVELTPDSYAARLFQGGLALYAREWERAVHSFRVAAEVRPTSSVLFANLAVAYLRLGRKEKAVAALKRSVALGPLNANAVFALADLAFSEGRHDEAIPALRYLLSFEQKNSGGWSRLARALVQIGDFQEALEALRAEASVNEHSTVWNNIGVVHARSGNAEKALSAFKHAMKIAADLKDDGYFYAGANLARHLLSSASNKSLLEFVSTLAQQAFAKHCYRDDVLSNIFVFYLIASGRDNETDAIRSDAEELLNAEGVSDSLVAWILAYLIARYGVKEAERHKGLAIVAKYEGRIGRLVSRDRSRIGMLYNNIAFLFAEENDIKRAERFLRMSIAAQPDSPYPIATLGLVDLKKGNVERGTSRYRRAISLANSKEMKDSFKQKLDLELGRYWLKSDPKVAQRFLERAVATKHGEEAFQESAKLLLRQMPPRLEK
jgi:tetratricopeptide (TPR) repeat protein